jgi:hypothetical protein
MQKYRISTNLGKDQKINVELKQDFDVLEILSLKFSQEQIYTSGCADYGVICGRVTANNGFGLGNARVSIFVPLDDADADDPVISALYPYREYNDKNADGYRYNLLPSRQQHGGHTATGTFFDQTDILEREEVLEVFEKYYNYTVKTNDAGDFMIWGVPVGNHQLHVDIDLSDIGCFSLRPQDLIRLGRSVDNFKNDYTFKDSNDLDSLPQIVSFDRNIEVYPFWGNESLCEIAITRADFDTSDLGIRIQPNAYVIGGIYTDSGKNAINKNCSPKAKMGRKCDLTAKSGKIEAIRFTPHRDENSRPYLQYLPLDESIGDDGGFVLPLPMNMDYVVTNEFGENEITNDPNKGIPTSGCYRLRIDLNDNDLSRARLNADYLIPNIREYQNDIDSSYYFGTEWSGYPQNAVSTNSNHGILYNESGQFYPRDYFYRFNYNKVYTVSSLQSSYVDNGVIGRNKFLGLKELVPSEEEDCSENVTPPVNFGTRNYTFTLLIAEFLLALDFIIKFITLQALNFLVKDVLGPLGEIIIDLGGGRAIRRATSLLQINNTAKLSLVNYPECEECSSEDITVGGGGDTTPLVNCLVAQIRLTGITTNAYDRIITLGNSIDNITGTTSNAYCISQGATAVNDFSELTSDQTQYAIQYGDRIMFLDPSLGGSYIYEEAGVFKLNDRDFIFNQNIGYLVNVRKIGIFETDPITSGTTETACGLYDTLYNESLATGYFVTSGNTRTYKPTFVAGYNVESTLISGNATGVAGSDPYGPPINGLAQCRDMESEVFYLHTATPSKRSEFSNGVFYIVPGTQSSARLTAILAEYYRRKRVGKMFCGGIVNYSFIDNWLSGSLYFFQFKAKNITSGVETAIKYCRNVVRYVVDQNRFYYRSAFSSSDGLTFTRQNNTLGFPTTFVDLGPRDEFIKEICIDKNLDPNCSVSRSIGATSFKSFGELMGLAINYRMDTSGELFAINNFFDNAGFSSQNFDNVLDGDLLQIISINNEAGIEEFDLQSPKYLGYSFQILDPDLYPQVFKKDNYFGPLPVTMELDEDGFRIRTCLNEPGRLTEASQKIPFYLWDKKGTGFGGTDAATSDNQSWDYSSVQVQPLQGMTYGYTLSGSPNNETDQYILLPITNTFSGLTISGMNLTNAIEFDAIIPSSMSHTDYNSQYPGFTVLKSSSSEVINPTSGTLYIRYGAAGTWQTISWNTGVDFILPQREDYYNGTKQILSTPFQFYFGLKAGKTGLDKFMEQFGPKGAFPPIN